ncbi:class I adenylate-forming enzyme family protein [uncultured Erythrobacter sp.]|uniref:class I adenylate-forming enzyme family protein n=1 Tax=uncultured Erythrobacter sp. TaxID=263913 RepID=UPI0026196853|nr:class I adenylate-forming enzyme family protein [uncultured Erythrobacter sp.]
MADTLQSELRLDGVLANLARTNPGGESIVFASEDGAGLCHSWQELNEAANAIGNELIDAGLKPGDRCAVFLEHGFRVVAAVYGLLRIGVVMVPIDPAWGRRSIASILSHTDITFAIGSDPSFFGKFETGCSFATYESLPLSLDGAAPPPLRGNPDEIAILAFTSGTTSEPKGVVITHRQIRFAYRLGRDEIAIKSPKRFGCFFRLSGLGILGVCFFFAAAHGATTVVFGELSAGGAKYFWKRCEEWQIDFAYMVPAVVQLVNRLAELPPNGSSKATFACAAAPLAREAQDTFQNRFNATLLNIYGLTELSFAIMFGARDSAGRGRITIGDGGPIETRLVDMDSRTVIGPGEGELQLKSPSACNGYWNNPNATEDLFQDGWLKSGDIARRDKDGDYYIVGRLKDVVIHGGFNIHLSDVDEALLAHENVLAAASVGVPDRLYGERVVAAVQLRDRQQGTDQILEWCRGELGVNRAPSRILQVEKIPVNGAGKVMRRKVGDLINLEDANA